MIRKKIKIPIYETSLTVVVAKKLMYINKKYKINVDDSYDAVFFIYKEKPHVAFPKNTKDHIIVHEIIHIVNHIFKYYGVELDLDNDEHQAYFTEYIFKQIKKCF